MRAGRGFPPDGPSYVGFHANSGTDVYTWAFANFVVRKPDESLLPAPAPWSATDPTVLFADRFQMLDPAWGAANDQLRIERNGLILEPAPERSYGSLYQGNLFGDCEIRVKVSQTRGGADGPAGIIFWAADNRNFYVAHFRSDGYFDVCRQKSGAWQIAVQGKTVDAVKRGLNEENELRVVTRGKNATVDLNAARVAAFAGEPPEGGSMVGLQGESGATPNAFTFWNFSVRKPPPESSDEADATAAAQAGESIAPPQTADDIANSWLKAGPAFPSDNDWRDCKVECIWQATATPTEPASEYWAATVSAPLCKRGDYLAIGHADDDTPLNVRLTCGAPTELLDFFSPQMDEWAQSEMSLSENCDEVKITVLRPQREAPVTLYLYKVIPPIGIMP